MFIWHSEKPALVVSRPKTGNGLSFVVGVWAAFSVVIRRNRALYSLRAKRDKMKNIGYLTSRRGEHKQSETLLFIRKLNPFSLSLSALSVYLSLTRSPFLSLPVHGRPRFIPGFFPSYPVRSSNNNDNDNNMLGRFRVCVCLFARATLNTRLRSVFCKHESQRRFIRTRRRVRVLDGV